MIRDPAGAFELWMREEQGDKHTTKRDIPKYLAYSTADCY